MYGIRPQSLHYETLRSIFGSSAALLTGSMKKAERDDVLRRIADGTALCVAGTHALLSGDVRFYDLGCVVTDEQHRFGVRQRETCLEFLISTLGSSRGRPNAWQRAGRCQAPPGN